MIELTLPFPPSINHYWKHLRHSPRVYISAEGMNYRAIVANETRGVTRINEHRVCVEIILRAPNRRKYDIDNRVKALLDALSHAGVWHDDEQVDELLVRRGEIKPGGEAKVTIMTTTEIF